MKISIIDICNFTQSTPSCRNFVEGERVLNANHVIFCGRTSDYDEHDSDSIHFIAFCLQTSNLRNNPHEITGTISPAGNIQDAKCSCKAGLSKKCKHCVAVFLNLSRVDICDLDLVSCTDTKCLWKMPHSKSMEKYTPCPLPEHDCLKDKFEKRYPLTISQEQRQEINKLLIDGNKNSALYKHISGRHEPVFCEENNNILEITDNQVLEAILVVQPSKSILYLSNIEPLYPKSECCIQILNSLKVDAKTLCEETLKSKLAWMKERQFRITGSRCYALYTYSKNKNANWKQKSDQYFYPKPFKKSSAIKHGIKYEASARSAYEQHFGTKIEQTGLIVPEISPWLGYSPDGVILDENRKPTTLIEIKCPFLGKTNTALDAAKYLPYLNQDLTLKQKHHYYGQIQLGMAILNLHTTDFIVYAPFDSSFLVISVPFNEDFANEMLLCLKYVFFDKMIHNICIKDTTQ